MSSPDRIPLADRIRDFIAAAEMEFESRINADVAEGTEAEVAADLAEDQITLATVRDFLTEIQRLANVDENSDNLGSLPRALALIQFAEGALNILESQDEWSADTTDDIAGLSHELGLSFTDHENEAIYTKTKPTLAQ